MANPVAEQKLEISELVRARVVLLKAAGRYVPGKGGGAAGVANALQFIEQLEGRARVSGLRFEMPWFEATKNMLRKLLERVQNGTLRGNVALIQAARAMADLERELNTPRNRKLWDVLRA